MSPFAAEGTARSPAPEPSSKLHPSIVSPKIGPAAEPGSVGSYETQGSKESAPKRGSSSAAIIGGSVGGKLLPAVKVHEGFPTLKGFQLLGAALEINKRRKVGLSCAMYYNLQKRAHII